MTLFTWAVTSSFMFLIPPALPGDQVPDLQQLQQQRGDLYSPEARWLVETFFKEIGSEEPFNLIAIFTADATYVDSNGKPQSISENLLYDGRPDIPQWSPVASGILSYSGSLVAIVEIRLEPVGSTEAALKFYFARNPSGALRISRIEEVSL